LPLDQDTFTLNALARISELLRVNSIALLVEQKSILKKQRKYMKDLKDLAAIVINFYDDKVACGKFKEFEECNYPCVSLAQIPKFLESKNIDWRQDYGHDKLTDLIKSLDGISIYFKGVPYMYRESNSIDSEKSPASTSASAVSNTSHISGTSLNGDLKPHEVRKAYKKLANSTEGWVSIVRLMKEVGWKGKPAEFTFKYKLQFNPTNHCVRIHNISRYEMIDDIYFDPDKNSFPSNVNKLRTMALDENWDENNRTNKLLDNYLCYTYTRVKYENKISKSKDNLYACWNTGLVDYRYEPIFCYMTRKDVNNRWMFRSFCINGEDLGKEMGRNISDMPKPATYFKEGNLLCQPNENNLSIDRDHIIREHPSRLPIEWLRQVLRDDAEWKTDETPDQYDKRICDLLPKDSTNNLFLQTLLKQTIGESVKRCQWNYKTAIPYYDPNNKRVGWFLPLCTRAAQKFHGKERAVLKPFAALVVTKGESGRFQGETIYRLSWAYRCARLVCRPDSDWLTPLFATDDKLDAEDEDVISTVS
jgi:hypothetical protein